MKLKVPPCTVRFSTEPSFPLSTAPEDTAALSTLSPAPTLSATPVPERDRESKSNVAPVWLMVESPETFKDAVTLPAAKLIAESVADRSFTLALTLIVEEEADIPPGDVVAELTLKVD